MRREDRDPPPLNLAPGADIVAGDGQVRLRRARPRDSRFLSDLMQHPEIEPFLAAVSASTLEDLGAEIDRSISKPAHHGRLVADVKSSSWEPVGSIAYEMANRRSRIAYLSALAISPEHGGTGLGTRVTRLAINYLLSEVGYHRVQCEVYAFNERALAVASQAGLIEEGLRRRAYWRRGNWVDGVLFGIVADDPGATTDPLVRPQQLD